MTFENTPLSAKKCHSADGRGGPQFFVVDWNPKVELVCDNRKTYNPIIINLKPKRSIKLLIPKYPSQNMMM